MKKSYLNLILCIFAALCAIISAVMIVRLNLSIQGAAQYTADGPCADELDVLHASLLYSSKTNSSISEGIKNTTHSN